MAKIAFSKLNLKPNFDAAIPVQIGDQTIAVSQYLSAQEKMDIVGRVVSSSYNPTLNGENPMYLDILYQLELVYSYTNLSFTDKQKEDVLKLYDNLVSNGVMEIILAAIPETEKSVIYDGIIRTNESFYRYQHSALGILNSVINDYDKTQMKAEEVQQLLDSDKLDFVREVVNKLG